MTFFEALNFFQQQPTKGVTRMITTTDKMDARQARAIVDRIAPLLAGQRPEIIGAVIGELMARYLASFAPDGRDDVRKLLLALVDQLVPITVNQLIKDGMVTAEEWAEPPKN
jgi:hypothetical protein